MDLLANATQINTAGVLPASPVFQDFGVSRVNVTDGDLSQFGGGVFNGDIKLASGRLVLQTMNVYVEFRVGEMGLNDAGLNEIIQCTRRT